jgi:hypothetical protein
LISPFLQKWAQAGLTQIHEEPTREKNLLDLVFTSNATLTKSSTNISGISDHAIIVTDMDVIIGMYFGSLVGPFNVRAIEIAS